MDCPECKTKMENVATISPHYSGDISTFILWCPNDGVVVDISDWTSKPNKIYTPSSKGKKETLKDMLRRYERIESEGASKVLMNEIIGLINGL